MAFAILLYPVLHECGHLLAAWMTGERIVGASLFVQPYVTLYEEGNAPGRVVFIAACGGFLPLVQLLLPDRGRLPLYGVKLASAVTGFFCAAGSAVSGALYLTQEVTDMYDDAVTVLRLFPGERESVFLVLGAQLAVTAGFVLKTRPLRRIVRCLEEPSRYKRGTALFVRY